jgi:hypothetical protein
MSTGDDRISLEMAHAIKMDWSKFVEITNGNLMMLFGTKIPQSLLPYPKNIIKQALDLVAEYFCSIGNQKAVDAIEFMKPVLECYVDDEVGISAAAGRFTDEKYLNQVVPKLRERQNRLLEELTARMGKNI